MQKFVFKLITSQHRILKDLAFMRYDFEFLIPSLKRMNFNTLWWEILKGHLKTWKMRAAPRVGWNKHSLFYSYHRRLIKEFPVGWKKLQGALLITKKPQPIKKTQPPPKKIQQPLPQKKPPNPKKTPTISFSVTSQA